jgi:MFS family permease
MDAVMLPIGASAIAAELNTNMGLVQAAIALVSLVAAPLYITGGKLGEIHGKKRAFTLGLVLYGVGVLAATLAPSTMVLIGGWSVVRALGMVLAIPASIGLLIASYEHEGQRGQAFAMFGVGAAAAGLVGPLLMGLSADVLSWRVPFALETILVVTTLLLSRRVVETDIAEGTKVDWGGTGLTFLAVASVLLGSMLGSRYGWWVARRPFEIGSVQLNPFGLSPAPLLIGLGVILAAILIGRSYRMEEAGTKRPLFSMKLFDNSTFATAWFMAMLVFVLTGALPFIVPVFLQQAVGFDGLQTALAMMAFSVGSIILGFLSGHLIQRMQPRTLMQVFLVVAMAGIVWLYSVASLDMGVVDLLLPMFVIGCGSRVLISQIPNVQLSTLSPELQGEGSGFAETGKELGIGLGTALIGSILFSLAIGGVVDGVARQANIALTPNERTAIVVDLEDNALPDEALRDIAQLPADAQQALGTVVEDAYVGAFQGTLGVLVGVLLMALLVASFIPKVETEEVTDPETKEAVADVSSRLV